MHHGPRPLVAGNWKMNGLTASLAEFRQIRDGLALHARTCDVVVCPPVTLLARCAAEAKGTPLKVGAQDTHVDAAGAFTGDISAEMIADAGATFAIVGHSERRQYHRETNEQIQAKARAAHRAGLTAIICVGETESERASGEALQVVTRQLAGSLPPDTTPANTAIAYEPIWAIGTGATATEKDIAEMHAALRTALAERVPAYAATIRLLYGGSVKPGNAAAIAAVANVDGVLVGGASLKAEDFTAIIAAFAR